MKLRVAFFVFIVCLSAIVFSCRRNQPSLVDANRPPDTEIWYAPPDSTEFEYLVHLYWRGIDVDGVVERYIWTITDTLVLGPLRWNPADRVADLRRGRFTSRTDSVFAFTAFKSQGGVGLKKNRQAFHIASIDDNGVIDPNPAAIEFVATVEKLPEIRFTTSITQIIDGQVDTTIVKPYDPAQVDTVGMFRPFTISYHAATTNGSIRGYRFFPLSATVSIPGSDVWNEDTTDTLRCFPNGNFDFYPGTESCFPNSVVDSLDNGAFRLAVQARDDANAESAVDASGFTRGVAQVVVNFDPETEIFAVLNTYFQNGFANVDSVNINPTMPPDTLPDESWATLFYRGWDSPFDGKLCEDLTNECITYQAQYTRVGELDGGASIVTSTVRWLPDDPQDTNEHGTSDSTSMNIGPQRYTARARAVDEYGRGDGTPPEVEFFGNLSPTLDGIGFQNFDGTDVDPDSAVVWNWLKPANLNPIFPSINDTVDFTAPGGPQVVKKWFFIIRADGHDHPKDPVASGIKSWMYLFKYADDPLRLETRFGSCGNWCDANTVSALRDTFKLTVSYEWSLGDSAFSQEALRNLPSYFNTDYQFEVMGRDKASFESFEQFMGFDDQGNPNQINSYSVAPLARVTQQLTTPFRLRMDN
jgi:hypothetical protein